MRYMACPECEKDSRSNPWIIGDRLKSISVLRCGQVIAWVVSWVHYKLLEQERNNPFVTHAGIVSHFILELSFFKTFRASISSSQLKITNPYWLSLHKKNLRKVPPRFELGSLDSESRVLTITPWDHTSGICTADYITVLLIYAN